MENYIKKKKSGNSQSYDTITEINCGDKLLNKAKNIAMHLINFIHSHKLEY